MSISEEVYVEVNLHELFLFNLHSFDFDALNYIYFFSLGGKDFYYVIAATR